MAVRCSAVTRSLRLELLDLQSDKVTGIQIVLNHLDRHMLPSKARLQKCVLGTQISQVPDLR